MTSFDTVGSMIILSEKTNDAKKTAERLLKQHKNIKTVAIKTENYSGKYRTPKLKILAGKRTKTTLYKENNVTLKLNPETCYFSARLATERKRIASLVKNGEKILVMFSGVAPYPIILSKNTKAKSIIGIEINPKAHKFALENLKLNKTKNVKLYMGDVKRVIPKLKKFDRIVMPHPTDAESYLDLAIKHLKKNGTIHFYDFQLEKDFEKTIDKIKKHCRPKSIKIKKCGQAAPRRYRIVADFKI